MNAFNNVKGFVSLIGLLLAVGIMFFIAYYAMGVYYGKPLAVDQPTNELLQEQNIDVSSQLGAYQSTVKQIKQMERQQQQAADDILKQMQGL